MKFETREGWLIEAADRLNDLLESKTDLKAAKRLHVSAGWPRRDRGGKVIGQCCMGKASAGTNHIFISPTLPSPVTVLPCLLHELIHAADDCESKHKGAFVRAFRALGFIGKPTECVPGEDLAKTLRAVAKDLGPYPHTVLTPGLGPDKPQAARQLKVECPECSYVCRVSRKWLDLYGPPICPNPQCTFEADYDPKTTTMIEEIK